MRVKKVPGRHEARQLRRETCRRAAEEAARPTPLHRVIDGVSRTFSVAAFQEVVLDALEMWLDRLAQIEAPLFALLNQQLGDLHRKEQMIDRERGAAQARADRVSPRLDISVVTVIAVAIAVILGTVSAWDFLEDQGWPLPVTLLAAIGVGALEIALAAGFGAMAYAVVLDDHGSEFELTPRQRRWTIAFAVLFGVFTLVLVIGLALVRGDLLLWLALGLAAAALGAYSGGALLENRHHLKAATLERQLHKIQKKVDVICDTHDAEARIALARGRCLRAKAADTLHRGTVAFERAWSRHHREPGAVAPGVPPVELPTDEDLAARLIVPLRHPEAVAPTPDVRPGTRRGLPSGRADGDAA